MDNSEEKYDKGFNSGYLIAKFEPELYSSLKTGLESKNEYLDGFLDAGIKYDHDKKLAPVIEAFIRKAKDIDKDI